jgi:hypothetical protein
MSDIPRVVFPDYKRKLPVAMTQKGKRPSTGARGFFGTHELPGADWPIQKAAPRRPSGYVTTIGTEPQVAPWLAVHVGDLDKLAEIATQVASIAARSPKKVNFCPPVATFIGTQNATEADLCQGLAIMVELDEQPDQSRQTLEALLGAPTIVVKSGGKWQDQDRCHAYWRLSRPVTGNDPRLKQCRTWASDLVSSDPTGKPVNHPLRWPGSWHKKGEPRLCRISEINDAAEIEFESAHTILKQAAMKAGLRVEEGKFDPARSSRHLKLMQIGG